jgi:lipoate---protein ligase
VKSTGGANQHRLEKISVLFSRGRDPARNLAREDELLRLAEKGKDGELVRFWIDSECLVRGKGRNPRYGWYDEELARTWGVKVIERTTGGGVVYHDEGNLNWSFFLTNSGRLLSPTQMFEGASKYVVGALDELGVPAVFAPPNRIDVRGRKVSGMAARSTPKVRLVHGTLLVDSDLEKLNRLCIPPAGCPPVANIKEWAGQVDAADVVGAFVKFLRASGAKVQLAKGGIAI